MPSIAVLTHSYVFPQGQKKKMAAGKKVRMMWMPHVNTM
jgi:hypothetical protein